ncbi:UNVERIFIED_CONTAM: hypothetical protein RMT77_013995 [Armadillidium vulgare]
MRTMEEVDMDISDNDEDSNVFTYAHFEDTSELLRDSRQDSPCCDRRNPHTTINWTINSCSNCFQRQSKFTSSPRKTIEPSSSYKANTKVLSVPTNYNSAYESKPQISGTPNIRTPSESSPTGNYSQSNFTKKEVPKSSLKSSRFYKIKLDCLFLEQNEKGLVVIWPGPFHEVDRYWDVDPNAAKTDVKNSSFYEKLAAKRIKLQREEPIIQNVETFVKDVNNEVKKEPNSQTVPFYDELKDRRCSRYINEEPCSSRCSYLHIFPRDDGVYCKYYYLDRNCPSRDCKYIHKRKSSTRTKMLYEDKYSKSRCPNYLRKNECKDPLCDKRHRFPKSDGVYCFKQLSLECTNGSECTYKHRDDLNTSFNSDSNGSKDNANMESLDSVAEADNNYDSDADSDKSGVEYYFPSSDSENEYPPYSGVGDVVNRIRLKYKSLKSSSEAVSSNCIDTQSKNLEKTNSACSSSVVNRSTKEDVSNTIKENREVESCSHTLSKSPEVESNAIRIKPERSLFDLDTDDDSKPIVGRNEQSNKVKSPTNNSNNSSSNNSTVVTPSVSLSYSHGRNTESNEDVTLIEDEKDPPEIQCILVKREIPLLDLCEDDDEPPCKESEITTNSNPNLNFKVKLENKDDDIDDSSSNTLIFNGSHMSNVLEGRSSTPPVEDVPNNLNEKCSTKIKKETNIKVEHDSNTGRDKEVTDINSSSLKDQKEKSCTSKESDVSSFPVEVKTEKEHEASEVPSNNRVISSPLKEKTVKQEPDDSDSRLNIPSNLNYQDNQKSSNVKQEPNDSSDSNLKLPSNLSYQESQKSSNINLLNCVRNKQDTNKSSDDVNKLKPKTSDDVSKLKPKPSDDVSKLKPKTSDDVSKLQPKPSDDVSKLKPKPSDDVSKLKPKTSDDVSKLKPKPSDDVSKLKPKPSDDVSKLKPKTSEDVSKLKPKTSEDVSKLKPKTSDDVSKLKPKPSDDVSKLKPKPSDDVSKLKPKTSEDVSKLKPKTSEDVNKLKPKTSDDVSKLKPKPSDDVSKLQPKPSDDVSKLKPKPSDDVSKLKPKTSDDVSKLKPKPSDDVSKLKPKTSEDVSKLKPKTSEDVNKLKPKTSDDVCKPKQNISKNNASITSHVQSSLKASVSSTNRSSINNASSPRAESSKSRKSESLESSSYNKKSVPTEKQSYTKTSTHISSNSKSSERLESSSSLDKESSLTKMKNIKTSTYISSKHTSFVDKDAKKSASSNLDRMKSSNNNNHKITSNSPKEKISKKIHYTLPSNVKLKRCFVYLKDIMKRKKYLLKYNLYNLSKGKHKNDSVIFKPSSKEKNQIYSKSSSLVNKEKCKTSSSEKHYIRSMSSEPSRENHQSDVSESSKLSNRDKHHIYSKSFKPSSKDKHNISNSSSSEKHHRSKSSEPSSEDHQSDVSESSKPSSKDKHHIYSKTFKPSSKDKHKISNSSSSEKHHRSKSSEPSREDHQSDVSESPKPSSRDKHHIYSKSFKPSSKEKHSSSEKHDRSKSSELSSEDYQTDLDKNSKSSSKNKHCGESKTSKLYSKEKHCSTSESLKLSSKEKHCSTSESLKLYSKEKHCSTSESLKLSSKEKHCSTSESHKLSSKEKHCSTSESIKLSSKEKHCSTSESLKPSSKEKHCSTSESLKLSRRRSSSGGSVNTSPKDTSQKNQVCDKNQKFSSSDEHDSNSKKTKVSPTMSSPNMSIEDVLWKNKVVENSSSSEKIHKEKNENADHRKPNTECKKRLEGLESSKEASLLKTVTENPSKEKEHQKHKDGSGSEKTSSTTNNSSKGERKSNDKMNLHSHDNNRMTQGKRPYDELSYSESSAKKIKVTSPKNFISISNYIDKNSLSSNYKLTKKKKPLLSYDSEDSEDSRGINSSPNILTKKKKRLLIDDSEDSEDSTRINSSPKMLTERKKPILTDDSEDSRGISDSSNTSKKSRRDSSQSSSSSDHCIASEKEKFSEKESQNLGTVDTVNQKLKSKNEECISKAESSKVIHDQPYFKAPVMKSQTRQYKPCPLSKKRNKETESIITLAKSNPIIKAKAISSKETTTDKNTEESSKINPNNDLSDEGKAYVLNCAKEMLSTFTNEEIKDEDIPKAIISLCQESKLRNVREDESMLSLDRNVKQYLVFLSIEYQNLPSSYYDDAPYHLSAEELSKELKSEVEKLR